MGNTFCDRTVSKIGNKIRIVRDKIYIFASAVIVSILVTISDLQRDHNMAADPVNPLLRQ